MKRDLSEIRKDIDGIDREIVRLLNQRFVHVQEVGEWKKDNSPVFYVPEREKSLLQKLASINTGPVSNETLFAVYREIMSGALALEHPMTVAYLGPACTFTHIAAINKFGRSVKYQEFASIADVFEAVERQQVDYGLVPVENSTEGAVTYTLDMLANSEAQICAETQIKAEQNLLCKGDPEEISAIYSHPQALAQCRVYLHKNYPGIPLVETRSTADAAAKASQDPKIAAIATLLAAEEYDLSIINKSIQDRNRNITRFLILGRQEPAVTGDDKTSIMFVVSNKVGALYSALSCFEKNKINMTMIESRPSPLRSNECLFFADFDGHKEDDHIVSVLEELKRECVSLKILGSYPSSLKL